MDNKTNIFAISQRAEAARKAGKDVIDGSVGMLLDEAGKLCQLPSVVKALTDKDNLRLAYPPFVGYPDYLDNLYDWIMGPSGETAKANAIVKGFATLGGTGALHVAFQYAKAQGFEVLIPGICWPNYLTIAKWSGATVKSYRLFDQKGGFDLEAIKKAIAKDAHHFRGFLVVVNDPCENPTGYTLTDEESQKLFAFADSSMEELGTKVDLCFDAAYLDFAKKRPLWLDLIAQGSFKHKNFIAFSASKTLGIYGCRLGALFAFFSLKKGDKADNMIALLTEYALGNYSMANGEGMGLIAPLFGKANAANTRKEIQVMIDMLHVRSDALLTEINANHIGTQPYKEGFYVTVKTGLKNPEELCAALEAKDIYVAPVGMNMIRIAICSLARGQEKRLVAALKELGL